LCSKDWRRKFHGHDAVCSGLCLLGQLDAALMMTVLRQVPPAEFRVRLPFRLDHDLAGRLIDYFFVGHGKDPPSNKLGRAPAQPRSVEPYSKKKGGR
jgi:hypothetical protein